VLQPLQMYVKFIQPEISSSFCQVIVKEIVCFQKCRNELSDYIACK